MTKYNGWTNYETWRVHLEWFDGWCDEPLSPEGCKEYVQEHLDMILEDRRGIEELLLGYAQAFLSDVNWHEISKHLCDENEEGAA